MNLLIYFLLAIAIQIALFTPAFKFKTDKLTDLSYTLTFIILSIIAFWFADKTIGAYLLLCLILIWAFRLGIFLFIRISKMKKDARFDGVRENLTSFLKFWLAQGVIVFILLIPTFFYLGTFTKEVSTLATIGLFIALTGILVESIADYQKYKFKSNPKNKNKFISSGLWGIVRHPNYAGEMLVWIGIYIFVLPSLTPLQAIISIMSPITIILLLRFVTGIPPLEKRYNVIYKKDKSYQEYKSKTPLLIPFLK